MASANRSRGDLTRGVLSALVNFSDEHQPSTGSGRLQVVAEVDRVSIIADPGRPAGRSSAGRGRADVSCTSVRPSSGPTDSCRLAHWTASASSGSGRRDDDRGLPALSVAIGPARPTPRRPERSDLPAGRRAARSRVRPPRAAPDYPARARRCRSGPRVQVKAVPLSFARHLIGRGRTTRSGRVNPVRPCLELAEMTGWSLCGSRAHPWQMSQPKTHPWSRRRQHRRGFPDAR